MAGFWRILLFVVLFSTSTNASENLAKNLANTVPRVNRLSECLLFITNNSNLAFMTNIRIRIETESVHLSRRFVYTAERFIASNDKFLIDLNPDETKSYNIHIRVYFVDSIKSLAYLINHQRRRDTDLSGERQYYLIVLPVDVPNPERVLMKIFHLCWENSIVNVNVLVEDKNDIITLYTYYPFTQKSCKDRTPTIHNRFINGSLEMNKTTFPSKTSNLWQCRVRWIMDSTPPYVVLSRDQLCGMDVNILTSLAEIMNFSLEIIVLTDKEWGHIYSSTNFTGVFQVINNRMADFMIQLCDLKSHAYFASTNAFTSSAFMLIVNRSKTYTPLEILLFPFDWYTWIGILILYIGKWISQLLRREVTRSSVSLSANFTRLCFTLWFISILILRSSYEGSIFKFVNSRPGRNPPKNLDDAISRGYKFVVSSYLHGVASEIPELHDKLIKFGDTESEALDYFDRLDGNYGTFLFEEQLWVQNDSAKYQNFIVVQEPVLSNDVCIYLHPFSHLTVEINKRLQQMASYGHKLKNYNDARSKEPLGMKKITNRKPESMSLQSLMGAFEILFILNGLSVYVFIVETFSRHNRRVRMLMDVFQ